MVDSDINLLERIKTGDENAFRKLFKLYSERFYVWALKVLDNPEYAEDVVQSFFVRLWVKRSELSFQDKKAFTVYAFRSIYNACVNNNKENTKIAYRYGLALNIADEDVDPKILEELIDRLKGAIDELPERCKKIFLMAKIERKPYSEVARRLGISENTVKVQVSKAYHMLREKVG